MYIQQVIQHWMLDSWIKVLTVKVHMVWTVQSACLPLWAAKLLNLHWGCILSICKYFQGKSYGSDTYLECQPDLTTFRQYLVSALYIHFNVGWGVGTLFQIGASGWFTGRYNFQCQPVDNSKRPETMRVTYLFCFIVLTSLIIAILYPKESSQSYCKQFVKNLYLSSCQFPSMN